jgi:two-component system response regulator VicR
MIHKTVCILLAEDDEELRFILAHILVKEGHRVEEISDGKALAQRLCELSEQSSEERDVDIVVSDIFMPGGSALDAVKGLKGGLRDLPIILISSAPDPQIVKDAKELGVSEVLSKPFDFAELTQLIQEAV